MVQKTDCQKQVTAGTDNRSSDQSDAVKSYHVCGPLTEKLLLADSGPGTSYNNRAWLCRCYLNTEPHYLELSCKHCLPPQRSSEGLKQLCLCLSAKLQRIKNVAARIVVNHQSKFPASSRLSNLHLVPIKHRINFNIAIHSPIKSSQLDNLDIFVPY